MQTHIRSAPTRESLSFAPSRTCRERWTNWMGRTSTAGRFVWLKTSRGVAARTLGAALVLVAGVVLVVGVGVAAILGATQDLAQGLALADAAPAPGPVPSQDTSLAPSLRRASLAHATVNLVLGPAHTNPAVDQPVASLAPAQTIASPGLRALLK